MIDEDLVEFYKSIILMIRYSIEKYILKESGHHINDTEMTKSVLASILFVNMGLKYTNYIRANRKKTQPNKLTKMSNRSII